MLHYDPSMQPTTHHNPTQSPGKKKISGTEKTRKTGPSRLTTHYWLTKKLLENRFSAMKQMEFFLNISRKSLENLKI